MSRGEIVLAETTEGDCQRARDALSMHAMHEVHGKRMQICGMVLQVDEKGVVTFAAMFDTFGSDPDGMMKCAAILVETSAEKMAAKIRGKKAP